MKTPLLIQKIRDNQKNLGYLVVIIAIIVEVISVIQNEHYGLSQFALIIGIIGLLIEIEYLEWELSKK